MIAGVRYPMRGNLRADCASAIHGAASRLALTA